MASMAPSEQAPEIGTVGEFARSFEPAAMPKTWFCIDAVCAAFSLVLLLLNSASSAKDVRSARECFIVYNFLTCVIWCVEVGLPVLAHGTKILQGTFVKLEMFAALYFLVDGTRTVVRWRLKHDYASDMDWTVSFNLVLYVCIMALVAWRYMTFDDMVLQMYGNNVTSSYEKKQLVPPTGSVQLHRNYSMNQDATEGELRTAQTS
jgi:hypothetical protein